MPLPKCAGQETTCGSQFSTTRVLGHDDCCQGLLSHLASPPTTIMLVYKQNTYVPQVFESVPVRDVSFPSKGNPGPGSSSHPKVKDWLPAPEPFLSGLSSEGWAGHGVTIISPPGKKVTDHSVLGLGWPDSRLARRRRCWPEPRASGCSRH